ncbi:MAG: FtsH protease activity modulator HflK [Alphaproteobacteria bacterium]|nr:MAG: FtsH protease activity modulator HflK [Alphaproteobacteria bacterium]
MSSDKGRGPWGGRPPSGGGGGGPQRPGGPEIPEIDEIVRRGQERLKVLMGGGGRGGSGRGGGSGLSGMGRGGWLLAVLVVLIAWGWASVYTIKPEQKGVELFFGKYYRTTSEGLHFAPWPVVNVEVVEVTRERTEDIGTSTTARSDQGLMLTGDENIVDIDFQVVWNIADPAKFLFTLRDPEETIRAVAESAMREIIARSELAPILNRDRGVIADELLQLIQTTLDSYDSGINIVRVNFDKADPPPEVIDAFREVQAAEQERDRLQKEADKYANTVLADARGKAAQLVQEAEAYRAQVVNEAEGEASRFLAVYAEYAKAPEVTRRRLYIETLEKILARVDKTVVDDRIGTGQGGVVPYLPLGELKPGGKR